MGPYFFSAADNNRQLISCPKLGSPAKLKESCLEANNIVISLNPRLQRDRAFYASGRPETRESPSAPLCLFVRPCSCNSGVSLSSPVHNPHTLPRPPAQPFSDRTPSLSPCTACPLIRMPSLAHLYTLSPTSRPPCLTRKPRSPVQPPLPRTASPTRTPSSLRRVGRSTAWGHWWILQVKRFNKYTEFGQAWTFECRWKRKKGSLAFSSQRFDPRTHARAPPVPPPPGVHPAHLCLASGQRPARPVPAGGGSEGVRHPRGLPPLPRSRDLPRTQARMETERPVMDPAGVREGGVSGRGWGHRGS